MGSRAAPGAPARAVWSVGRDTVIRVPPGLNLLGARRAREGSLGAVPARAGAAYDTAAVAAGQASQ